MQDLTSGHPGNIAEAVRTIQALNSQLNEANAALGSWKISIDGKVESTNAGFVLKLNVSKPNGSGFIKTISTEEIAYYVEDPDALIQQISEEIFEHLLKKQIHNEITTFVTRGLRNAHMMQERS